MENPSLKDKDGIQAQIGDIFQTELGGRWYVSQDKDTLEFISKRFKDNMTASLGKDFSRYKIIGNIIDNPYLLRSFMENFNIFIKGKLNACLRRE